MKSSILFIVGFSLFLGGPLSAQSIEETKDLAHHFYEQGQYTEALYYFERIAFFSPTGADAETLALIGNCFLESNDFTRALEYFDHAYFAASQEEERTDYLFKKILTYIQTKNYQFALVELLGQNYKAGSPNQHRKDLYLGLAYFGLEQFETAGKHLALAVPEHSIQAKAKIDKLFSNPKNFSRPNPKTAMILSVIFPGMGQWYSGDAAGGINSLLLTGSFVALVLYLSVRIHPIDAILTGLPWFQRYYQGGFDHAENQAILARERNRNLILQQSLDLIGGAL